MKKVFSVLWRNYNKATYDTLTGKSAGQYDIRLGSSKLLNKYFELADRENVTANGGFDINIDVEGYNFYGTAVSGQKIGIRYMGPLSARNDWYIRSQRPKTAYPMWIEPSRMPHAIDEKSYVVLIRTMDDKYYGRVLLGAEVKNLPQVLQEKLSESPDCGLFIPGIHVSNRAEKIYLELLEHKNLLLYGPPGTGKTTLMQEVVSVFNNGGASSLYFNEAVEKDYFSEEPSNIKSKTTWTTFHQSYSYEEFIIGMSTDSSSKKLVDIRPAQGKLLELSEFARKSGNRSLLVIDELNRGNVSKVFGEFITVIEPDKRLGKNGEVLPGTVEIQLPYLKYGEKLEFTTKDGKFSVENPYTMPSEVYTIASMNSIDKSIYPLDSALRRRFFRINVYPDIRELEEHFDCKGRPYVSEPSEDINDHKTEMLLVLVKDFMGHLNKKIQIFMGKDYTLGFSYVWNLKDKLDPNDFMDIFSYALYDQILPQLEEIFRNREEQLMYVLGCEEGKTGPYEVQMPSDEELDLGGAATDSIRMLRAVEMVRWMERICG